jgi:hypothetical protein
MTLPVGQRPPVKCWVKVSAANGYNRGLLEAQPGGWKVHFQQGRFRWVSQQDVEQGSRQPIERAAATDTPAAIPTPPSILNRGVQPGFQNTDAHGKSVETFALSVRCLLIPQLAGG